MRTLLDIDFLADEALRGRLAAWSAALLAGGAAPIALLVALGALPGVTEADALLGGGVVAWLAALIVVSLAALPAHELIHGVLFRLMGGPGVRVSYGHAAGMLYAGCPGLVLARPLCRGAAGTRGRLERGASRGAVCARVSAAWGHCGGPAPLVLRGRPACGGARAARARVYARSGHRARRAAARGPAGVG